MAKNKGMLETAGDYWARKLGLDREEKTAKKRLKLRQAKKAQRQARYGKKLGHKAVETRRKKQRQMDRIAKGED